MKNAKKIEQMGLKVVDLKSKRITQKPKKPNGFQETEWLFSKPKKPDKEEDNDKEDDKDNDNDVVDYKYKDKELKKVIDEYENNIAPATATSKEILQSYYNDLGSELIIEAIRRASLANKRNCKYVQGILNSWIRKGYKTLIEVRNEEEEFKNKKNTKETNTNKRGYSNYSQRDPDTIDFNKFYANKPPGETI